ncbi:MAG: MotA/TolQ/ExbB proton channel family protein [Verrucomicrobiota bacterium]
MRAFQIRYLVTIPICLVAFTLTSLQAQETGASATVVAEKVRQDLQKSEQELSKLREEIASRKIPLNKKLNELEKKLIEVREEYENTTRTLDTRNLDLNNLRKEITSREKEVSFLQNLFEEYVVNFETKLHISEIQRYRGIIDEARLAPDDANLNDVEQLRVQSKLIETSVDRLEELVGGVQFEGNAVDTVTGDVKAGTFTLIGPIALFASKDGTSLGLADQQLGSTEPAIIPIENSLLNPQIQTISNSGIGLLPLDPTRGDALKMAETKETIGEHLKKGGFVVWPLLGLAALAMLVGVAKLVQLSLVGTARRKKVDEILDAVGNGHRDQAIQLTDKIRGPVGEMLRAGVEHMGEPKDLIEEVMFERLLDAKLKLNAWLPFISVTASAAPLLGLLGTVTGIIETFKLITVYGAGDAKSLSSGISEALITTEVGLCVAIPSLLFYAFLSRKASGIVSMMEKVAMAFLNRMQTQGGAAAPATAPAPTPSVPPQHKKKPVGPAIHPPVPSAG